jgi:hypothetical protein
VNASDEVIKVKNNQNIFSDTQTNTKPHQSVLKGAELLADSRDLIGTRPKELAELGDRAILGAALEDLLTSTYTILHRLR